MELEANVGYGIVLDGFSGKFGTYVIQIYSDLVQSHQSIPAYLSIALVCKPDDAVSLTT